MKLGLGIAAGPDAEAFGGLAAEAEALGYDIIVSNDHPAAEGLPMLAPWAGATSRIDLGVGVLAMDRHQPASISTRLEELALPRPRLVLGVGAGFTNRPLGAVREGVAALRGLLPDVRVIVAAMGPQMCSLAGEIGDGALLNWMTPQRAAWARELVIVGATRAGRSIDSLPIYGYIRVAMGAGAAERLAAEAGFYTQLPHYARHFEATGTPPEKIGIAVDDASALPQELARYDALDVAVVRVLAERDPESIAAVARAAIA